MQRIGAVFFALTTLTAGAVGQSADRRPRISLMLGGMGSLGDTPIQGFLLTPGVGLELPFNTVVSFKVDVVAAADFGFSGMITFPGFTFDVNVGRFFLGVGAAFPVNAAGNLGRVDDYLPQAEAGFRWGRLVFRVRMITDTDRFLSSNLGGAMIGFEF